MPNKMDQWGKKNVVEFYVNNRNRNKNIDNSKVLNLIELGINHEQQHQELILMDILIWKF